MQKNLNKNEKLIKTLLIFLIYFSYTKIITTIFTNVGVKNNILISFFADIVFLGLIIIFYKKNLKDDFCNLKNNYKISKIIKIIFLWIFIIFTFDVLMGYLTDIIWPNIGSDENTKAAAVLLNISTIYVVFKAMIFATIAEELLFREAISDIFTNKFLFIIISALIYAFMNSLYNNFLFADILMKFFQASILSLAYVKNNNNIVILILIKFVYQFIPLTLLLLGI